MMLRDWSTGAAVRTGRVRRCLATAALMVPLTVTGMGLAATPALAATSVVVPGTAGPASMGGTGVVDTGVLVAGSVTVSASGTINASTNPSFGQGENPNGASTQNPPRPAPSGYLAPGLTAWSLLGRLGTTGAWQQLGTGPITLNGAGQLFLAVNDDVYGDNSGQWTASITVPPAPPPAPTVTTGPALEVGGTTARLTGTVNGHGQPFSFRFVYGLTSAYGQTTTPLAVFTTSSGDTPVAARVSGLTPGATYHYALEAATLVELGSPTFVRGADRTFTTVAAAAPAPAAPPACRQGGGYAVRAVPANSRVRRGGTVVLRAEVSQSGRRCQSGVGVSLSAAPDGSRRFRQVATSRTDARGVAAFRVTGVLRSFRWFATAARTRSNVGRVRVVARSPRRLPRTG